MTDSLYIMLSSYINISCNMVMVGAVLIQQITASVDIAGSLFSQNESENFGGMFII